MADDDVTVMVEPDLFEGAVKTEPEIVKTEPAKTEPPKTAAKAPAEDLAEQFKAEARRERERREVAERAVASERQEREKLGRDVAAAREEVADRELDTINAGISSAQIEADAATTDYKAAFEAGDADKMATAQRKLARAEAKSVRLDEAKADLESRRVVRSEQQKAEQQQRPAPSADPVDAYIQGRTEPTAKWLRSHREWITDPRKNAKLTSAHFAAVAEGIAPDSDEYFEHVETFIGLRDTEPAKTNGAGNGVTKPRRGPPAAPVAHSGGGTNGSSGNEVRLSRNEATAATDGTHIWNYDDPSPQKRFKRGDPIGVQEFARRKLEMTKQGLYDRTYVES